MKVAKLYLKRGWWEHYRTEDGHTFAVRDNKYYFYDGNTITNEYKNRCYIEPEQHAELFSKIKFER